MTVKKSSAISLSNANEVSHDKRDLPVMDLSVAKNDRDGRWPASKLAAIVCFLAAGAILSVSLVAQHGLGSELAGAIQRLF